jgi:acyl-CoA synthetase (AMP-forming)/AMP-acid ligase II
MSGEVVLGAEESWRTLGDAVRAHGRAQPDAVAFSFNGRETSWAAFDRHTDQVANGLIAGGVKPGQRVSYLGKNSDQYFEIFLGAAKMGAVMAPIGWRLAPPEVAHIVNDAEAHILFVGRAFAAAMAEARALVPGLKTIICMEEAFGDWPSYAAWRDAQPAEYTGPTPQPDNIAIQLYTSGTTGKPKGAMLTHYNLLETFRIMKRANLDWNLWTPSDICLVAMPVSHIGGSGYALSTVLHGAKSVIAAEFDVGAVLDFIIHERISKLFLVPSAMRIVLQDPRARKTDYSRLSHIVYGASPIPLDLLREAVEVFGCGFAQAYGMTETTGMFSALPPGDHDLNGNPKMRSAGKALPDAQIVIKDQAGNILPAHTTGEIVVRWPGNMAGYWKMDEATEATLDTDGWLRTGDAGYLDEDGYVYIHDRVKDMIISGGENIYPAEVESAVFGHPAIADVAVIGVPSDKWGEEVKAVVVVKPDASTDADDIIAFARTRIAHFKAPKSVDFVDALPRNASGKILHRQLREPYWAGAARRVN